MRKPWFVWVLLVPRLSLSPDCRVDVDLLIHFDDQLLVVVESQRLSEREQVLWAIVTLKRFRDRVLTALYATMTEPS
ncbi:MAG TPA: hypothetical protein VEV41_11150 [Terriglobales bacterium]|nr:hypothetical protein [Terriglobales bacterium]